MRIAYFTHSLESCWNHGNAHFLRGTLRALQARGHSVAAFEPHDAWSRRNLVADAGETMLAGWRTAYPDLDAARYHADTDVAALVDDADLVLVHEWNEPALVARLGAARRDGADYTLLFHDTHHRAVSEPGAMAEYDLSGYDGVLAFGATLASVYRERGWARRVFVWHEAADTTLFQPPAQSTPRHGGVWIGNWGDGERTEELERFLFAPSQMAGLPLAVHGVRYPESALAMLRRFGATYHGWLANHLVSKTFARHLLTVHVPRRFYAEQLPGIPTIRVFEALACGIPLISAPWQDSEDLFTPGKDFLVARDGAEMQRHMTTLMHEPELCAALASRGLATIRARHSCGHRADELLAIAAGLAR